MVNHVDDLGVLHLWIAGVGGGAARTGGVDRTEEEPVLEQIMGLPTHVLLVHVAVVLVPLLAAAAACYALLPILRPSLRWLVIALAVVAPLSALLTKLSGDAFFRGLQNFDPPRVGGELFTQVLEHRQYGSILAWVCGGLGIAALLLVYVVERPWLTASGRGGGVLAGRTGALVQSRGFTTALTVVTLGLVVTNLIYVYLTGESGARMVWDPILREG